MSPTIQILIVAAVVICVDAGAHAEDCMTFVMSDMMGLKTADGKVCFPQERRLSDLAKSPWRRLDGHDAIMATMCDPTCLAGIKTFVDKCDGVPDMQESVEGLKMLTPMCDDECFKAVVPMMEAEPKTASGAVCFPDRRRLSELSATPFSPWRRLGGHTAIMENICEPECQEASKKMLNANCEKSMDPEMVGMAVLLKSMLPMCSDPCLKGIVMMEPKGCDGGDESSKVCDFTGVCKDLGCDIKANCDKDKPAMEGMSKAEWQEGLGKFLDEEAKCPMCPATTSSGTQTMLTGFVAALLFAAFALQ
jgi:hypothetical protein